MTVSGFLPDPPVSDEVQQMYDGDVADLGYVMNLSRLWAHQPGLHQGFFELIGQAARAAGITFRQRGILVTACASAARDSYCSLAWGRKLAGEAGAGLAEAVVRGDDGELDPAERALARWARQVATDPSATAAEDVAPLREAGFDDGQIFAITAFVALRLAFAAVNDSLGALPDRALLDTVPGPVLAAVDFGRPIDPAVTA
jgi:uncharacterized peroxidase-related enzyme